MDHHNQDRTQEWAMRMVLARIGGDRDAMDLVAGEAADGGCMCCVVNSIIDRLTDTLDRYTPGGAIAAVEVELCALLDRCGEVM